MQPVLPCYILVIPGYLVVASGYLVIISDYWIVTTDNFSLLLVTSGYFSLLLVLRFSDNSSLSLPIKLFFSKYYEKAHIKVFCNCPLLVGFLWQDIFATRVLGSFRFFESKSKDCRSKYPRIMICLAKFNINVNAYF